eukprot:7487815-Alexandrium_andersonii.AAC.1
MCIRDSPTFSGAVANRQVPSMPHPTPRRRFRRPPQPEPRRCPSRAPPHQQPLARAMSLPAAFAVL